MVKRKVIIDTDCGGDDAVGVLCALTHPDVEVVAITCVWGNVDVDQAVVNISRLLDVCNKDVPVFAGCNVPILGERETVQWGGFGSDGFGDAQFPQPLMTSVKKKHASLALIDILSNIEPEEGVVWQLVCLGPLTNVAMALRIDGKLFDNLGADNVPGLIVMGGAYEGKGNSSLTSEFNIHCDPEAARIVLHHRSKNTSQLVHLVTWELTVNCPMPWDWYDKWLNRRRMPDGSRKGFNQNRLQIFLEKVFQRLEAFTRPKDDGTKADTGEDESTQDVTCVIPDAVAVVAALYSNFILESFDTFVTVELQGRESRGMTCVDWYGTDASMARKQRWRNCKVITRVSAQVFLDAMTAIVSDVSE